MKTQIRRYTHQMAFVGTQQQADAVQDEAQRRGVSKASVLRILVDAHFNLTATPEAEDSQPPQPAQG